MSLTPEQLQVLRESTVDETAFQRVVAMFEEETQKSSTSSTQNFLFDLDPEQVEQLSAILNTLPVAIYVKDIQCRFIMANQYTMDMMKVDSLSEIIGKSDFDLLSSERSQFYFDAEQEILRSGKPVLDFEIISKDADGRSRWFLGSKSPIYDKKGKIVGLIGINREITRQKLAEKSLEEERNLLRTLIDHIEDKIYIKDRASRFIIANKATLEGQRTSAEAITGTSDFDFMPAERAKKMLAEEQAIMESGVPILNQELFTPADVARGDDMWFMVSKIPVIGEERQVTGLVGVNRNITSRKLAEQRKLELELERKRSEILANFVKDTSHEFKTPISVILTSTYLLKKVDDRQKQEGYIKQIVDQTHRLGDLIDSLMFMSRLDSITDLNMQTFNLGSFLSSMVDKIQAKVHEKQQTVHLIDKNMVYQIEGQEEYLAQAIYAILDNAVRYTPEQGTITLHYDLIDANVVITIQDTGMGISTEAQPHIYNRFFREDNAHTTHGFGLGLAIAKRVVELHSGHIEFDSKVGGGSTFRIILPQQTELSL